MAKKGRIRVIKMGALGVKMNDFIELQLVEDIICRKIGKLELYMDPMHSPNEIHWLDPVAAKQSINELKSLLVELKSVRCKGGGNND